MKEKCLSCCRPGSSIDDCMDCKDAGCSPKPFKLEFNEEWVADCPRCESRHDIGHLKPIQSSSFATYIRKLWDFQLDNGKSFCERLSNEATKVSEIKQILDIDGLDK